MKHDYVFWALMIATAGAFSAFIGSLVFLYLNAKNKKRGEK
jgi:hypothetical protein